jgi:hypothetical protein
MMRSRPVSVPNLAPGRKSQRCQYSSHDGAHGSNSGPRRSNHPHRESHASHNRSEYLRIRDASGRGDATIRHDDGCWRGHRRRIRSKRARAMPTPPRGAAQTPAQEIHGPKSSQTEHSVSHGSGDLADEPAGFWFQRSMAFNLPSLNPRRSGHLGPGATMIGPLLRRRNLSQTLTWRMFLNGRV